MRSTLSVPTLLAAYAPGPHASALAAALAYRRAGGPMLFPWPTGRDVRACQLAGIRMALANERDGLRTPRDQHAMAVADGRLDIASRLRREAARHLEWVRFYEALKAELADDRSAGLGAVFPEARIAEAA